MGWLSLARGKMVKGDFKIRSLEAIGTSDTDIDVGVVRVSGAFLKRHSRRNALVRISLLDELGRKKVSIVRIVRAATGKPALRTNEIALQYDDRVELGIRKAGMIHTLEIEPVNDWTGIPRFLLGHPSPLVRKDAIFGIALMIVGALVGFVVGLAL